MARFVERTYPYVLALAGAGLFWYRRISLPTSGQDILSASITLGSIFTGFLATAQSIVVSFQSPRFETFRATKFYPLMLGYLQEAIWASLTYCAIALLGYFYEPAQRPAWFASSWMFLTVLSLTSFFRASSSLTSLIKNI